MLGSGDRWETQQCEGGWAMGEGGMRLARLRGFDTLDS